MTPDVLERPALPGLLDVAALDAAIQPQLDNRTEELCVDLQGAQRLDAGALLLCAAIIGTRARADLGVVLRLPREHEGRDFLRTWNFQTAVETSASVSLRQLTHPDDRHLFGEDQVHYVPQAIFSGVDPLDGIVGRLEGQRFFASSTYRLGTSALITRMIQGEWSRWRRHLFLEGLGPHLRGPRHDVARVVIQELLANAAQHPNPTVATVASTVTPGADDARELAIALWDDGTSIVDTLRRCLTGDRGLRAMAAPVQETFALETIGWESAHGELDSSYDPEPSAADGELLAASLMAGISRKPWDDVADVERPEPGDWEDHVGYGLYALYRSVINDFAGELHLRTHGLHLRLGASDRRGHYLMCVEKYADRPDFAGNMITVRLPIVA
jgi:hypothetical protein